MRKKVVLFLVLFILLSGFDTSFFSIDNLEHYNKAYKTEELISCSNSSTKTYMDYRAITNTTSKQYKYIQQYMEVHDSGLLIDKDGFIGVALGSYYGNIGDRFYFTLDTGVVLPVVKIDAKADIHTDNLGCQHSDDSSVLEFVIDFDKALNFFGRLSNQYVLNGNFNNYETFKGKIVKVEKVLDEKVESAVTFVKAKAKKFNNLDIFVGGDY